MNLYGLWFKSNRAENHIGFKPAKKAYFEKE